MSFAQEYSDEKVVEESNKFYADEKAEVPQDLPLEEEEIENSKIEAVRLVIPVTDDPSLPVLTFRFWIFSLFFGAIGAIINQYYYFRTTSGTFPMFFVNFATYAMGTALARILPTRSFTIGGFSMSLNPGPFNVKENAMIYIAVGTAAGSAYAIDILVCTDLYLNERMNALGALILLITTQCLGYGMAGMLRKYLVYPAEMVWWGNLVQVVFFNALHNTDEFKAKRMVRGWSYMKFFWVVCGITFLWELIPQWVGPGLVYFDWICWIKPFNFDFWALFSSTAGGGIMSLSWTWTSINGATLWTPLYSQLCSYGGAILSYWIVLPALWLTNTLNAKTYGVPLSSHLFYGNGSSFDVTAYLESDNTLNEAKYDAGPPVSMTPMYALNFFYSFISLGACVAHIAVFHGREVLDTFRSISHTRNTEDIHTKLMKVYPEVPQWWYAVFYVVMLALSIVVCECYGLQLPWWGLLVAVIIGWALTFPICALTAITGNGPGLNVITELICGYMLPGKPIANMTFKCYGYMAMYQCLSLLSDLKLGHYMKIPPRAMFVGQVWGTIVGAVFNYFTMIIIINARRPYLNGTEADPNGLWSGYQSDIYWGSALIFGALGPKRMFDPHGSYGFVFWGFLLGVVLPPMLWALNKKFPSSKWQKFNVALIAGGMSSFPNGYAIGILPSLIVCVIFQWFIWKYNRSWWKKYTFILSASLDTGAALTGLMIFFFLGGGVSPKLSVEVPSWWFNHYNATDENFPNYPYLDVNHCGAADGLWTGGITDK
ncbi:hypothetical protein EMPS_07640 [Entomortierella parvispora]|uniref:Uncharacterized protein n=1 Tax=Entomortierella parvispora TaxID=205924 RepID=A0A9P3HES7_9FUNG|nr:hypothetical protein EMPS_07640 [Entomortierella parvispora]